ncbi:MAG: divalent-cation tolerance protein CutA [Desulforhabdus sp.]|jgi:periplasmic divalent cation tolerance protein|nr:divalent-cation tolerance protein CutA [Desulforhabdus sp.]
MANILVVFVTVGDGDEAFRIGRSLVEEKLVACVNMIPQIRSIYWWKGEVCDDQEVLLVMKTPSYMFDSLQSRIRELHSYELPEIIALPVDRGLPEYLDWVVENTIQG